MHKKLTVACMAISAWTAFACTPPASDSPVLTESGTAVAVVSSLRGTNTGLVRITGAIPTECTDFYLAGTLTENTGTSIRGEIPVSGIHLAGTGESEDCTSPLGAVAVAVNNKLCWVVPKGTDFLTITGCGETVTYTLNFTGTGSCKYGAAEIWGESRTKSDFTVNIFERSAKKVEGGLFCPAEVKLDADLNFNTTDGSTLLIA